MRKRILILALCFVNVFGTMTGLNAASLVSYEGYVKKTSDLVTSTQTKETTGKGTNWVEYVEENRKLVCWINNGSTRVTDKKSYTDSGYQYLTYSDASANKGKKVKLVVSTSLTTLPTTRSFGSWSPDETK